jgi:TRAP-type C4-dicarboxylate transport system permease small subunit
MNILMVMISAVFLLGLTFIVGADITLRYLFLRPLGWVKEISEYILVVLGFLVAAWILKDDGHVKMDLVLTKVSPKAQTLMNIVTSTISTIVVLVITWFSVRVTLQFYQTKLVAPTVLEPQKWILLTPIFLGALLLAIQFVRRTFHLINQWKTLSKQKAG